MKRFKSSNSLSIKEILELRNRSEKEVSEVIVPLSFNQISKLNKLMIESPIENDIKYLNEYKRIRNKLSKFNQINTSEEPDPLFLAPAFLHLQKDLNEDSISLLRSLQERKKGRIEYTLPRLSLNEMLENYYTILNKYNLLWDSYSIASIQSKDASLIENITAGKKKNSNTKKEKLKQYNLKNFISNIIVDIESLSVEKYGAAPNIKLNCPKSTILFLNFPEMIDYVFSELLKNSLQAIFKRFSASECSDLGHLEISLESKKNDDLIRLYISDNGVPFDDSNHIFDFLFSTAQERTPTYTYSQNFGDQKEGFGVGTSVSRVISRNIGGDLTIFEDSSNKKTFLFTFSKNGETLIHF